jgi:hypothetical protein
VYKTRRKLLGINKCFNINTVDFSARFRFYLYPERSLGGINSNMFLILSDGSASLIGSSNTIYKSSDILPGYPGGQ